MLAMLANTSSLFHLEILLYSPAHCPPYHIGEGGLYHFLGEANISVLKSMILAYIIVILIRLVTYW